VRVRARIGIDRALLDRNLLGAALGDAASWSRWLSVLRAAFALPMSDADCITFAEVAGDRAPPGQRVNELWCVCGRRSGKTRIAAAISVFIAAIEQHKLASGEVGYVLLLAASRAQASIAFSYVMGFLQNSAILRQQIESMTADEVRLKGNIIIGVHAGSYRTIRGRSLLAVVGDETSFWRDIDSAQPDVEIFRACAPALAATRGLWVGISTGYRRLGLLYQKWRDHYGQDGDDVLVVQGASSTFNLSLDLDMIERAKAADPEAAESEWGGGFRADISAFLDDATIEASVNYSRPLELPPQPGIFYRAFIDASGGRRDHYTVAIAHKDRASGQFVVDVVRGVAPPFDPMQATEGFAKLLRDYHVLSVTGDNFGQEWVQAAWRSCNMRYTKSELPKSQIYLECLPLFTRGLVGLPEHKRLLRELRLLERHTHRSGKDTVDHGKSGSDDYSNVACGVLRDLSNYLGYSLDTLTRACSHEEDDPNSEAARKVRDQEYRNQFAARIYMLSGGQCWPR
jgi:hypothetical protein